MSAIEAVTFDLDGTLYDHGDVRVPFLLKNVLRLRVARVGKAVREEMRARAYASGAVLREEEARTVAERLELAPERARVLLDEVFDASLTSVLAALAKRSGNAALKDAIVRAAYTRDGAGERKLGIVSDRRIDDKLVALGLADVPWAAKVSADDTGLLKPSPRPFLIACERMGVDPSRVVHIGDRDDTDGAGARAAGVRFVLVGGPRDVPAAVAGLLSSG